MKKLQKIIKLSFEFLNRFLYDYVKNMLKYIIIGGVGFIFLPLAMVNPVFILGALFITIPAFCYSFWRGYVATYALNFAAFEFYNNKPQRDFKEYMELAKKQEKGLIGFVSFIAVVTIAGSLPGCISFFQHFSYESILTDPQNYQIDRNTMLIFTLSTVALAPFINFSLQAFFFRKKEDYITLLANCYRNTGILGFVASTVIIGVVSILSCKWIPLYLLLFMPLNLLIYSFNTFYYFEGIKRKMMK